MTIFENGYLNPKFINPNYKGLVGWSCRYYRIPNTFDIETVISFDGIFGSEPNTQLKGKTSLCRDQDVKIKKFTVEDIPVGELCWMGDGSGEWVLCPFGGVKKRWLNGKKEINRFIASDGSYEGIVSVPYLIAETKEDAEKLKDLFTR
jgi:hypothetical protein